MDQETLFTGSKWDILKSLGSNPKSPIELAQESKTSVANISQQLRLLEMAGIVTSERISNRDRGQPRIKYRIANERAYVIGAGTSFVEKGWMNLDPFRQCMLGCWLMAPATTVKAIEEYIIEIRRHIPNISLILIDKKDIAGNSLIIATDDAGTKQTLTAKAGKGITLTIKTAKEASKLHAADYSIIHDPSSIFSGKGGK
ncbi:MAG: helix-turn-helix domain-containing protein [Candidatus Woesearchaeota archaeon]